MKRTITVKLLQNLNATATKVIRNTETAYYLAFAYNYQKDENNALKWFQIAKNNSSSVRNTCKEMIDDMQIRGITVPDASGSTGTQAGGTPDGSAADNTTADNSDNNTDNE